MDNQQQLDTLKDIKQMMERSSRFISLSGLSGIAAGCCALVGAWFAYGVISGAGMHRSSAYIRMKGAEVTLSNFLGSKLLMIAIVTFIAAFILAFLFTYLRSRKNSSPMWGFTSKRVLINVAIPMVVGGIYLLKLIHHGVYGLIAPGCLIFYGLALVNASKYTLSDIRYLGYGQLILGIINLVYVGYGLYFWALGFGVLHILYGAIMWWKYERN